MKLTKKAHSTAEGTGKEKAEESKKRNPTGSVRLAVRWTEALDVRLRRKITKTNRFLKRQKQTESFSQKRCRKKSSHRHGGSVMAEEASIPSLPLVEGRTC